MVAVANTFEGGTAGGAVTTANSGGTSGDAWTTISDPANATITYETAAAMHGSLGGKVTTTANTVTVYMEHTHTAADRFAQRVYFQITSLPGVASMISRMRGSTNTAAASVQINSANKLQLMNSTGTGVTGMTMTNALSINTWYRLEWAINEVTGVGELAYYSGDSTTAIESLTSASGQSFGTEQIAKQRIGRVAGSTWQGTIYYDSYKAQDLTSGFIGPNIETHSGSVSLSGDGSLTFASIPTPNGNLALSGSGTLSFAAEVFTQGSLGLGGEGTLFMESIVSGSVALSGSGTLSLDGVPFVSSALALSGDGALTFDSQVFVPGSAALAGEGALSFSAIPNEAGSVALSGSGALTFAGSPSVLGAVGYSGSGTLAGGSGMTLVPLASIASASGWTATGGTVLEVLGDTEDSTLITSSGDPSNVLFDGTFGAIVPPSGAFTVRVRTYKQAATSGTLTGKLYVNTTLKSTVSVSIPDVLGNVYLVFPAGDLATITAPDWAAGVRITLAATAN